MIHGVFDFGFFGFRVKRAEQCDAGSRNAVFGGQGCGVLVLHDEEPVDGLERQVADKCRTIFLRRGAVLAASDPRWDGWCSAGEVHRACGMHLNGPATLGQLRDGDSMSHNAPTQIGGADKGYRKHMRVETPNEIWMEFFRNFSAELFRLIQFKCGLNVVLGVGKVVCPSVASRHCELISFGANAILVRPEQM